MKIIQILILFFIINLVNIPKLKGQNFNLEFVKDIELIADAYVGEDKFKNLYYINNNTVFKKDSNSQVIAFKDVMLGDIERVDILNPNKIIVFYKLSNTVVVLDNRMTEIDRQDFNTLSPFKNVGFAGTSRDQSLWIYNIDLNQLELFDYRFDKVMAKSLPINADVIGMKNNFNICYLFTDQSILIYNIYGSLLKTIYFKNIKFCDLYKNNLVVYDEDELLFYNQDFEVFSKLKINISEGESLFYNDENIYLYNGKNLKHYKITNKI